jgi:hypothetical protein
VKRDHKKLNAGLRVLCTLIFAIIPMAYSFGTESKNVPHENKIALLSQDKQWLRLLHLAAAETKVISSGFYLSTNTDSYINPKTELELNLQQAQNNNQYRCQFPARDQWIREHFTETNFVTESPCFEFDSWRNSQSVDSISIVYPDRNMQTSLGVFSHTFLKFNLARWPINSNLNIALGFAAELNPHESMVQLVSKGLFGGYIAKFTFSNYYAEVNRYGESESRDIFEYKLALTKDEINFLLKHLWELKDAEFHYYFLNGNCSYHLLTLLEIARPELDLTSHFNFFTVPSTSLRVVLSQNNLISDRHWTPGKQTRQNQMMSQLSSKGKVFYQKWRFEKQGHLSMDSFRSEDISLDEEIIILDLLAESTRGNPESADFRKEVLNIRSNLPAGKDQNANVFPKGNPETAHGVELVSVGIGHDPARPDSWVQMRYRIALHNFVDPPEGYSNDSTFELGDLRIRYSGSEQTENSSFTIINAVILQPWADNQYPLSWEARSRFIDFLKSATWQNSGGLGLAKTFDTMTLYSMVIADSYMDKNEKAGVGIFAGASAGVAINIFDKFRIKGNVDHLWKVQSNIDQDYNQGELQIGFSKSTTWSTQLSLVNSWRERSLLLEALYYY